jgi:putative endonuclease
VLLSLKDGRTYVGYTDNFKRRLNEHNNGRSHATRNRIPFKVLFIEEFSTSKEARQRETYWKSGGGRRKLKKIFTNQK